MISSHSFLTFLSHFNLKEILLNRYWLYLSLVGIYATSYIFNYKGTGIFLGIGAFFVFIHMVFGEYSFKDLTLYYRLLIALVVYLILSSVIFSFEHTDSGRVGRLVKLLVIVFSIHMICLTKIDQVFIKFSAVVLGLSIVWQYSAHFLYKLPYGTFTNPHYLASFVLLTLPITFYFLWTTPKYFKIPFFMLCLMDTHLLILSSSRPAILGIVLSTLLITILFSRLKVKITGTIIIMLVICVLFISNYADIYSRFKDLFDNIRIEERMTLWPLGWKLLSNNSLLQWLFGNGLGEIAQSIPSTSHQLYNRFPGWVSDSFPHMSIFELLYENGIIGTLLIICGLSSLVITLSKLIISTQSLNAQILAKCILIILLASLFHTGITMHFYSKQTLYLLGFVVGISFSLILQCQSDIDPG